MDNVLQELYHGMIHPQEEYQPTEEIWRRREKIDARQQVLLEGLKRIDPELNIEMNKLLEEENHADALEMEEAYIRGMRMGAKLALALMGEKQNK